MRCVLLAFALVLSTGCGNDTASPPAPPSGRLYPEKTVVHWQMFLSWDSERIEEAAESKLAILPIEWCFADASRGILDELHRLNPDIQIIGYQSLMSVYALYPDTSYLRATIPYALDYYNAVREDWAWTTVDDTLMTWRDLIVLNPIKNGELNSDLITKIVDLIARYQTSSGNAVDGVMHDYFSTYPYINATIQDSVHGDIDFDDDAVIFADDPDERSLFVLWQREYAMAMRERFGDDFIQIGNGRPPQEDAVLAHYLNGIYYELYPNNPWGATDRSGLLRLLENQEGGYLSPAKGRTWSICTNVQGHANYNNLFCLLSSLLADCLYTELYGSDTFSGWTLDIDPGSPLGSATIEGALDSVLTVRRPFVNGEIRISFEATGRRLEYLFDPVQSRSR